VIDEIIQQKPDALVHAGSLFDVVKPRTRAYTTVLEALDRIHAAGIPFIPNFKSAYYLRKIRPGIGIEYKKGLRLELAQR
jgi:hypothetical protein